MCGIVGYNGAFSPEALRAANQLQRHRGPDGEGLWYDSNKTVGLAHKRLSIIDLSPTGSQPMADLSGNVVIVFNGEIYNFRELRLELEKEGGRFRGHSDTEVILNLYLRYGIDMLPRLNGIFALAIWDARHHELFLARDALGVKPLYFAETPKGFAFASEIKALFPLLPQEREMDIPALHRYLSFLWCPGEGTPLRNVRKLLPGEGMVVREGKVLRRWKWYRLPVFRGVAEDLSEPEALVGTADHLRRAVHRQLVADVPVGAFLSGGLDSSAVVAFAREKCSDIRCFTIEISGGHEEGMPDDLPYARRVAAHLNVPLEVVHVKAENMASDLEGMVGQLDEPLADPAALNVLYISQLARDHGIKVLLSGAGGDDIFTGYRRHLAMNYELYWNWLPQKIRSGLDRWTAKLDQRVPVGRRLKKLFNGAGLEGDQRLTNFFLWANESELHSLYTPGFLEKLDNEVADQPLLDFLKPLPTHIAPLTRMLALEQRFFLSDHNLAYTDKMSMAVGVEVRVPFLDTDLVEFAARIPVNMKQKGKEGKWILKKAMEPYLPDNIIYRQKTGFGAPLRHWLRCELRDLLEDVLSEKSLKQRGLFEPKAVRALIKQNENGQVDAAYTLLSLICIEIWCRSTFDSADCQGTIYA